jgi:hypothetical protein
MICKGSPKILTATGADTYTWEPGTVDGDSYLISGTSNETLVISGTGLNGCTATDTIFVQVVDCTGLSDLADERSFLAYPNPAKDKIMIRTAEAGTLRAEMWDVAGKVIHREEWGAAEDSGSRSIDVRGLDAGIYFLKLSTQGHTETLRVIKQ